MQGKVAIITGSATGLGKRTAIELAKNGVHIVLNYRSSKEAATQTAAMISEKYGVKTLVVKADVSSLSAIQNLVQQTISKFKRIDLLIHNAGPFIKEQKTLVNYTHEEWRQMVDGNLNSYFYLLRETLPYMQKQQWGRVIMMGFNKVGTAPAWKYRAAYAAAKSGAASLTKTLALEEAENGITFNVVCPGDIKGDGKEMGILDAQKQMGELDLEKREGTGEDIARMIVFLCEEKSDYVSGNVIEINGGQDILSRRNG